MLLSILSGVWTTTDWGAFEQRVDAKVWLVKVRLRAAVKMNRWNKTAEAEIWMRCVDRPGKMGFFTIWWIVSVQQLNGLFYYWKVK